MSILAGSRSSARYSRLTLLLFLRDWRSSLIVVAHYSFATHGGRSFESHWADDQHYDARRAWHFSVGVLVDGKTVYFSKISKFTWTTEEYGESGDACSREVAVPRFAPYSA